MTSSVTKQQGLRWLGGFQKPTINMLERKIKIFNYPKYQIAAIFSLSKYILSVFSGLFLCSMKIVHSVASEQFFSLKFHELILHYCIVVQILFRKSTVDIFRTYMFRLFVFGLRTYMFRFFVFSLRACIHEYYHKYSVIFQFFQKSETGLFLFRLIFLILFP